MGDIQREKHPIKKKVTQAGDVLSGREHVEHVQRPGFDSQLHKTKNYIQGPGLDPQHIIYIYNMYIHIYTYSCICIIYFFQWIQ